MSFGKIIAFWLICAMGTVATVAASILWVDTPIAHAFAANIDWLAPVGRGLASPILVFGEMGVMAALIASRLARGRLPYIGKAILIASATSLATFAVNEVALKFFFGMPNPTAFLFHSAHHAFRFWHGSRESSLPSGHMALAASWAFTFAQIYPRTLKPLCAALLLAGAALIIGDWHFLSDVIAGTFVGGTAGSAAGILWVQHNTRLNP